MLEAREAELQKDLGNFEKQKEDFQAKMALERFVSQEILLLSALGGKNVANPIPSDDGVTLSSRSCPR
jgi:hypothetical protein